MGCSGNTNHWLPRFRVHRSPQRTDTPIESSHPCCASSVLVLWDSLEYSRFRSQAASEPVQTQPLPERGLLRAAAWELPV